MKSRPIIFFVSLIMLLMLSFCSCSLSPYPPDVTEALDKAENNRAELEKVLTHFIAGDDTLKLQAAYFLIGNMEGHCYATYNLLDSAENIIEFDPLSYPDYETMKAACDTLEDIHGELDFDRDTLIYDLEAITADFLINQIDYAFKAWREKPWAQGLSFDNFCDYVLPYRGSSEPLESWRESFWEKYKNIDSSMTDPADPIEAAALINDDIKSWFTFDPRFYYHPTDLGLAEMLEYGMGRCEDMTNVTIYAMRAVGLAVTSDYTPHWANSSNNHAWNSIVAADGKVTPFMGAERNPGLYKLSGIAAKVYRKTFGKKKNNLIFQERKQEKVPGWLAGKNYVDVTADYVDVCDVTISFERDIPDSVDIAYLCVFNSGEWRAIHWGRIENGQAVFTDMGVGIAYMPALYVNEEIVPFETPFILNDDCSMLKLQPDSILTTSVACSELKVYRNGLRAEKYEMGKEYELFYWHNDNWQTLDKATVDKKPLVFDNIPAGSLYRVVNEDNDDEERIFTIKDGKQVWW
ncbi:MAG: transglutaminase domain-containing protein [candidate division Zixibacteria bacterium]|nr:transglutaminase domain-containing protein [candidate division Zixibacteria bacterium]